MSEAVSAYLQQRTFKAVQGGYIFQPAPPTSFHRTSAHLVNEEQKAEILRAYASYSGAAPMAALASTLAACVAIFANGAPGFLWGFAVLIVWLVMLTLGVSLVWSLKLRALRPILVNLPPSAEKLFPDRDRSKLLFETPSPLLTALSCAATGFALGLRFLAHPPFADPVSSLLLVSLAICLLGAMKGLRNRA